MIESMYDAWRRPFPPRDSGGRVVRAFAWLGLCAASALAGCSSKESQLPLHPVKGQVLLGTGKPLTAGRVTFVSVEGLTPPASGEIRTDGSFSLGTRNADDGAIAGQYKVRIEPASPKSGRTGRNLPFPVKYVDEDSSGLIVTVGSQTNQLEPIRLK